MSSPRAPHVEPVLRTASLRAAEARHRDAPLMERAGRAAADDALQLLGGRPARILVLAGPGNNGGDAFVVARHLRDASCEVTLVFAADEARLPADAALAARTWREAGGAVIASLPERWRGELVVDGLFGLGLKRPLDEPYARWVAWMNDAGLPVLAIDVPSGIDADTGAALGPAVHARRTSTFLAYKPGLLTGDGLEASGELRLHDLGTSPAPGDGDGTRLRWDALAASLPVVLRRDRRNVHKGSFGTLAVVGGAAGMIGAPLLAGRVALKTGAGRVRIGYAAASHPDFDPAMPELMVGGADAVLHGAADALVVGPGLGLDTRGAALVDHALRVPRPLVLDADALTLLAQSPELAAHAAAREAPLLLTPHPAEAARLLGCTTADVQKDRLAAALTLARRLTAEVVLKGAGSVIAHRDGAWAINATGNAGLATAGSGDVLAGMLGAFLAQRVPAREALRLAVCLHGAAADALVAHGTGPLGIVASEIADAARDALNAATRDAALPASPAPRRAGG